MAVGAGRRAGNDRDPGSGAVIRTLTTTAWAHEALDDHRGGQAAARQAVTRLECAAQNPPCGSGPFPVGLAPRTSTSRHGQADALF